MRSDHDNKGSYCLLCDIFDCQKKFQLVVYKYRISSNNSPGRFSFHTKRGQLFERRQLFEGDDYFKYCSLDLCPTYFVLLLNWSIKSENNRIKWTENRLLKCFKFGPLLNFQCQHPWRQIFNRHWSVFLDEKGDAERGWVRAIIRERRLFEIFLSKKSDYWNDAINRRTGTLLKHCL